MSKKNTMKHETNRYLKKAFQQRILIILSVTMGLYHFLLCQLSYFMDMAVFQSAELYLCGALLLYFIVYCFVQHPKIHFQLEYAILIALMLWYLISCLAMNEAYQRNWLSYNQKPLIDTSIALFIFFPLGVLVGTKNAPANAAFSSINHQKNWNRPCSIIISTILIVWTIFIAYVLVNVFQLNLIDLPNGGQIGMSRNAALCLNCHYNTTGAWQTVFFLGCVIAAIIYEHIAIKTVFSFSAVINYVALVLSNSRTSFVAAMAGFAGIMLVFCYSYSNNHHAQDEKARINTRSIIIAVSVAIVSAIVFLLGRFLIYYVFQSVTHFNQLISGASSNDSTMVRELIDSTTSTLTGRTTIWKGAIKGMISSVQRFFLGVTPVGVNSLISLMTDGKYDMYTHNQILEVGVALGVPAMCAFIVWFFLILKSGYLQIRKTGITRNLLPLVFVLALMLGNMAEATLMFYQYITSFVFFFWCGWIYGNAKDLKLSIKHSKRR